MQNISPTHIKLLTLIAPTISQANDLAESAFLHWSKDHPGVNICQVDRDCRQMANDEEPCEWIVTITIMYDLAEQFNAIAFLMRDLEVAVEAWRAWVKDGQEVADNDHQLQTLVDMRIQLSQPFAALIRSFDSFRNW